jgi:hypothetical protein
MLAVSSVNACSVVGPHIEPYTLTPFAKADASTHYGVLSADDSETIPEGAFWAGAFVQTAALHTFPEHLEILYSEAEAHAELSLHAKTSGPVRPGLIDLAFRGNVDFDAGRSTAYVEGVIGNLFAEIQDQDYGSCRGACDGRFAFVLGQPFDIRLIAHSHSWGTSGYGNGERHVYVNTTFQLRELDGTPVDLLAAFESPTLVPEPSTILLVAPVLSLLMLVRVAGRYRRGVRSRHRERCRL